jgi:undecaprenyl-diphosphatase
MSIVQALIFGIVEGITEFLPISSTGHLMIADTLLHVGFSSFVTSFNIYIQLGAILAVVVLYFKKIFTSWLRILHIIAAFLPTAIIGLLLFPFIKKILLENLFVVGIALIGGGVIIIIFEYFIAKNINEKNISIYRSVWIGVFQALAVIPGVSRSAATIIGGRALGIKREDIVEFSFLLAIPTMLAATGLDLIKSDFSFSQNQWLLIAIGFVVAFLTALAAVKWFLSFIQKHGFAAFGWYRIVAGLIILIFLL